MWVPLSPSYRLVGSSLLIFSLALSILVKNHRGVFGILGAMFAYLVGEIGEAFNTAGPSSLYGLAAGAFVFSVVGIVGGLFEKQTPGRK